MLFYRTLWSYRGSWRPRYGRYLEGNAARWELIVYHTALKKYSFFTCLWCLILFPFIITRWIQRDWITIVSYIYFFFGKKIAFISLSLPQLLLLLPLLKHSKGSDQLPWLDFGIISEKRKGLRDYMKRVLPNLFVQTFLTSLFLSITTNTWLVGNILASVISTKMIN